MQKSSSISVFAYLFTGILFIISDYFTFHSLSFILKGLIIPSLIVYFLSARGKERHPEDKFIIAALIFSWAGDVLLDFRSGGELMFLLGLVCFLITHVFYTIVFFGTAGEYSFLKSKKQLILVIILYGSLTLYLILPGLGTMQIPVTVYGIIITGMVIGALSRFKKVNDISYLLVFLGALLFLISDSLLAFNKFKQAFAFSGVLIMGSYLAGQYMMVLGLIKQYRRSS